VAIDAATGAAGSSKSLTLNGGNQSGYDGVARSLPSLVPTQVEFYVKSTNNTLTGGYFVGGQSAYRTNSVWHFRMDGTGVMGLTDGPGNFYSIPYSSGQWYKIDLELNWSRRTVDFYVNDGLVMPNIPFCNPDVTSLKILNLYNFDHTQAWWDQVRFSTRSSTTLSVLPAKVPAFSAGVWSGTVTVSSAGTNLTLVAADNAGHAGISTCFDSNTQVLTPVTVVASPSSGGSVAGGGSFTSGSAQTISAAANPGWGFVDWQDGNTQNPRPITVPSAAVTYTASFLQLPQITSQPVSQIVNPGDNATFAVSATGPGPLGYLWMRNGTAISGATNSNYTLSSAQGADSSSAFICRVSNPGGVVLSDSATLTVRPQFESGALALASHAFTAAFNGYGGSNYVILVSTNLRTWTPLMSLHLSAGSTQFTDTNASQPWQFYRIQVAP
jgi:Divergent InlB B-repeat domain/Immunoglobulin domain